MIRLVDSAAVHMTYLNEKFPARLQVDFRRTPRMGFLLNRSHFPAIYANCELADDSMSVPVIRVWIRRRGDRNTPWDDQ